MNFSLKNVADASKLFTVYDGCDHIAAAIGYKADLGADILVEKTVNCVAVEKSSPPSAGAHLLPRSVSAVSVAV